MNRRQAVGYIFITGVAGAGIVSGYKWRDWNKAPDLAYLDSHKSTIAALAETIIPSDLGAPGATEAKVADYIILMIKDCTGTIPQNRFIDGLKELERYCKSTYGKPYAQCSLARQELVLKHFEAKGAPYKGILGKAEIRFLSQSFWTTLKELTVKGYCTSEPGATIGLAYVPVPGSYHGCIPKLPGQRAWATR